MRDLIKGIVEFREKLQPQYAAKFQQLAQGQEPDSFFISCSDSRVVPDLIACTDPGELFTMRNVGNLVPPSTAAGDSTGDISEASGIEFAVLVLKVKSIIICGHSECGAMKAALANKPMPGMPNLEKWLHHAKTAVFRLENEGPLDEKYKPHDQLSQLNVLAQMEHLASYPIVREAVESGQLKLGAWWFDIGAGEMLAYERKGRRFSPIDRALADRVIAGLGAERATA